MNIHEQWLSPHHREHAAAWSQSQSMDRRAASSVMPFTLL